MIKEFLCLLRMGATSRTLTVRYVLHQLSNAHNAYYALVFELNTGSFIIHII